jgi:hypothetical protein
MVIAWLASLAAGAAFYRWVEMPLGRMLTGLTFSQPRMQSRAVAKLRAYR